MFGLSCACVLYWLVVCFGRRNWTRRYFVLRDDKKLSYYERDEEGVRPSGVIDIEKARLLKREFS